jgi:hypothetical protein
VRYEEYDNPEFMVPLLRQLHARRHAFEVLGLPEGAPLSHVKAAFRKQVRRLHPDRKPRDPKAGEKLQLAIDAYRLLTEREDASPRLCAPAPGSALAELPEPYFSWWRRRFPDLY